MRLPEPSYYDLTNHCPKCGGRLYAAWMNRVIGLPFAPVWSVECNVVACNYFYPSQFENLEEMSEVFEAED